MTKKIARVEVRIPPDIKEQFSDNCLNEGKNSSEVIRDFIYQKITPNVELQLDENKNQNKNSLVYKLLLVLFIFISGGSIYSYSQPDLVKHEKLYYQFNRIDQNRDGVLTVDDFEKLSNKLLKKFAANPEQYLMLRGMTAEQRVIKLEKLRKKHHPVKRMNYYDIDQDSIVTFKEFSSLPPRIAYIKWGKFQALDTNGNNYITYEEFYAYATEWFSTYKNIPKRATYFSKEIMTRDLNGDKQLSLKEYELALSKKPRN